MAASRPGAIIPGPPSTPAALASSASSASLSSRRPISAFSRAMKSMRATLLLSRPPDNPERLRFPAKRAKLVVGDEAAFAGSELLHLGEQVGAPLLVDVDAELLCLDPDRVEATLLA